jgi:predicted lipoprotein with Yx(FWY)xxD motif
MPNRLVQAGARHPRRSAAVAVAGVAGVAMLAVAALALAKSFTLKVLTNVHVTNTPTKQFRVKAVNVNEAVAVGPSGYAVYTFQGETTHHIICKKTASASTNCWAFWPPVSPSGSGAVSKQSGISGTLGTFKNHGVTQLTLNGQPLYYFTPDIMAKNKHQALGDELKTFGSIWHIVKASGQTAGTVQGAPMQTSSTTSTTSTNPYPNGWG